MKHKELPVYCAWCKKHMYGPMGKYATASHSICPPCLKTFENQYKKRKETIKESIISFEEFLVEKLKSKR